MSADGRDSSFMFARRLGGLSQRRWVIYCVASGVAVTVLIVLSMFLVSWGGVIVALTGAAVFGWVTAISAKLRSEHS